MTSRRFFLTVLSIFLMASSSAFAGLNGAVLERLRQQEREKKEQDRQREEASRAPLVDPDISINMPQYAGNGCPQNSVALVRSPDNKALSVLFDQFINDAGSGQNAINSKCQLKIPMQIHNGKYRLKIIAVDLRGGVQIDDKSVNAVIRARSWLEAPRMNFKMPTPMASERENFRGPIDQSFTIRLDGDNNSRILTGCTDNFILNVSAEVALRMGRMPARAGLIALDSIDSDVQQGGLVYQLGWEQCR